MIPPSIPSPPNLHFLMRISVSVASPIELGEVHANTRRVIPISGGTFEGPTLRGEVLPTGEDWQYTRPDRVAVLEARYVLRTHAGDLISVTNRGFRHGVPGLAEMLASGQRVPASLYYFMTAPLFESASPHLQWLSRTIFIAEGQRELDRVVLNVWQAGDKIEEARH